MKKDYTEDELQDFRDKDKRISIQGFVQALIETGGVDVEEVDKNIKLAKQYSDKIYEIVNRKVGDSSGEKVNIEPETWENVARKHSIPEPQQLSMCILNKILNGSGSTMENVLLTIWNRYKKYPTKDTKENVNSLIDIVKM